MKTNRKNEMPTDGELKNIFRGFCSDEEMDKTIKDAKKAFTFINRQKEFRK